MAYRRYYIRAGARTTAGGTVRASSQFRILGGAPLAREGDAVDCPACNTQGRIACVMPRLPSSFEGRAYALSDDVCVCECSPPPKLVADQDLKFQVLGEHGSAD